MQVNAETVKFCHRRLSPHSTEYQSLTWWRRQPDSGEQQKETDKMVEAKRCGNEREIPEKSNGKTIKHRPSNNRECGTVVRRNC